MAGLKWPGSGLCGVGVGQLHGFCATITREAHSA